MAFYEQMNQQVDDIWENSSRVEGILADFQNQYAQDNRLRDQHMQAAANQINRLTAQQQHKNEAVIGWLQAAGELAEFITSHYDHWRFAPGEVDKIYQRLELAQGNLAQGMPEAALGQAQQAYMRLSELHLQLEQQTLEWQAIFDVTWHAAINLYELIKNNASCPALDMEGRELPISLQLNFWSNGQFGELIQKVKNSIQGIKTNLGCITCQQLESILQNDLPEYRKQFEAIIYQARFAAINSQLRINIADIALQALSAQGFVEDGFGYVSDDKRSPYYLRVKNIDGSLVTIWVNPLDNQENCNDLVVESQDSSNKTERELRQRSHEIIQSLQRYGLRVGGLENAYENAVGSANNGRQHSTAPSALRQQTLQQRGTEK
jgi:hypothetical protein